MLLDYACSWLVVPPSSPALGSWGKDPDCHKGLGGVFCVSGPRGLSTEGSWVSWSTSWSIFFWRNWHLSHSWFDPSCTVVPSHSSALLGILFPLFSSPWVVCVLFPHLIHLPPSCSPSLPPFFCPFTPVPLFSLRTLLSNGYFPLFPPSFHPLMHCLFLGTNLTRFVFSQTFRAPPARRPQTATNGTVDASCSATNAYRPPPATAS